MRTADKTQFRAMLSAFGALPESVWLEVEQAFTVADVPKGTILAREGRRDGNEYFLLSGILRSSALKSDGQDVTLNFYTDGQIVVPNFIRTNDGISVMTIEAMVDGRVAVSTSGNLHELRRRHPSFLAMSSIILSVQFRDRLAQQVMHATLNGREKLEWLRKRHPNLENMVQHSHIASYLGMTNVTFSRLRGG